VTLRARAFTLLEVMAVVLILGFVFLVMGNVYQRTVGPTATSPSQTEATRRGLLLIDRVARDLEGATLVEKPKETDPLAHPWLFFAESRRSSEGADRLKFDTRSARPTAEHATDLSVVAYWVEPGEADDLRLVRWTSPALPESLERELPSAADANAQVVASGVARFGVRFTDDEGAVVGAWDSSTVERSGQLPIAADVTLALFDATAPEGERVFRKRVLLPIRPIDLEKALSGREEDDDEDEDDEEDDEECVTLGECQAQNPNGVSALISQAADPAALQNLLDANADMCVEDVEASAGIDLSGICP
jgi:hypothetical protein